MVPRRILAASDLSKGSDEALLQAHARAVATGAELAVCHALPHLQGVNTLFPQRNAESALHVANLEGEIREALAEQLAACLPGAKVEVFVDRASAYAGIVQRAETWSADLVVVGSHGRTGLPRMLLGSVAEQVVRHAHCAVLVARAAPQTGIVVAATDLSDPSMPAIVAAADEARQRKARLVVVHAIAFGNLETTLEEIVRDLARRGGATDIDEQIRSAVDAELQRALVQCGAQGETRVVDGVPAAAIVRTADELGAELVVVGTRGRTGLVRIALGSTADRIVRNAACSVLAVRLGG
jgi:nucleotide-binding universal stress UspA family protein